MLPEYDKNMIRKKFGLIRNKKGKSKEEDNLHEGILNAGHQVKNLVKFETMDS